MSDTKPVDPDLAQWYETVDTCLDIYLARLKRGAIDPGDCARYFDAVVPDRPVKVAT